MDNISESCEHIQRFKNENGVYSYEILHAFYVSCLVKESRQRKARDCICQAVSCKTKCIRVHACLSCVFFGCFVDQHIHAHAREFKHFLAVDTNFGYVYCYGCNDYKYDDDFEKISYRNELLATAQLETYKWKPNPSTAKLLQKYNFFELGQSDIEPRGIVNMGYTCYISAIFQSLVHAPVFRDYFLSGRHRCHIQKKSESQGQLTNSNNLTVCFMCEMSSIVQEFFCGKVKPYIPDRFLYLFWTHAPNLSGYRPQDAHEFFLELLNIMQQHSVGMNGHSSSSKYHANCIIDSVFTGTLKREIICLKCKHTSTKIDIFRDISLNYSDLTENAVNWKKGSVVSTIAKGLERFTETEYFRRDSCDKCAANLSMNEESTKESKETESCSMRTTFEKLPIIISFKWKHQSDLNKVKIHIKFPEFLDMTPYMSSKEADSFSNMFYLFAVVCYKEIEEGGHYYTYVRQHKRRWFSCNDVTVTSCGFEDIQEESNFAYILFYHKQYFEYEQKPKQEESCITSETLH